ncbi:MAG: hypothetical protein LQ347_004660 [Umbilicaria vellea]|nr:MAG: hypothetical protein LQ347_004660 [Umbilicaria vellea]
MEYDSPRGSTVLKLSDTNYLVWAETVQAYLEARDHWDVVDEDRKPLDPLSKEYKEWRRKDRKSWYDIWSFCNQAEVTIYKPETAKELWDRLKKRKPIGPTYFMAQFRAFMNYKQGPKETAEQTHLALRTMQAEMLVMSPTTPIYDNLLREVFLGALREKPYGPMVFRIRNELVEPSLEDVFRHLKEREIEQALNNPAKNVTANSAKADHAGSKQHQRSGGGGGTHRLVGPWTSTRALRRGRLCRALLLGGAFAIRPARLGALVKVYISVFGAFNGRVRDAASRKQDSDRNLMSHCKKADWWCRRRSLPTVCRETA